MREGPFKTTLLPDPCNGGMACVFPFTYMNVTYNNCTDAEFDQMWCSIATDANGTHIEGQWMLCGNCTFWIFLDCRVDGSNEGREISHREAPSQFSNRSSIVASAVSAEKGRIGREEGRESIYIRNGAPRLKFKSRFGRSHVIIPTS